MASGKEQAVTDVKKLVNATLKARMTTRIKAGIATRQVAKE